MDKTKAERLKNNADSFVRKSPRFRKKFGNDFEACKDESSEPIIDVFPLAEEDIDSELWIKEELGIKEGNGVEETLAISVLESELNKVFNANHAKDGKTEELWKKIPGISYIIGIKPDIDTKSTKCRYDCVMCSSHMGNVTLTDQELKIHIQSRQHVINVMMVENNALLEEYGNETLTEILFDKILKYELHLGRRNIIPATENTYKQEREKVILQIMDDLTAQEELKYNNQKEIKDVFSQMSLHVDKVVRKFNKITIKNMENHVLSVMKKLVDENISTDITYIEGRSFKPTKVTILAKGPSIVHKKVLHIEEKDDFNQNYVESRNVKDKEGSTIMDVKYLKKDDTMEISMKDESDSKKPKLPFEQVAIITDSKYLPNMGLISTSEEVKVIAVEDMKLKELNKYIPKDAEYISKKTLYLIVVGVHSMAKTHPMEFCEAERCEPILQSLAPFKKCSKQMKEVVKKLKFYIEDIKLTLPEGSDIAVLPPLPLMFINNFPSPQHRLNHYFQDELPLFKFADNPLIFKDAYPKFMYDILDIAYLSLQNINKNLEFTLDTFRNNHSYLKVKIIKEKDLRYAKGLNFNFWGKNINFIIDSMLAKSKVSNHCLDSVSTVNTNGISKTMPPIDNSAYNESSYNKSSQRIVEFDYQNHALTNYNEQPFINSTYMNQHSVPSANVWLPDFSVPPPLHPSLPPSNSHIVPQIGHVNEIPSFDRPRADFYNGGLYETANNVINRDPDEIIQFAKVIQNCGKASKQPGGFSHMFSKVYIVGAKAVINPFMELNIKNTIINHNFNDFEDNDFNQLLNKIGSPQQKSLCCLVFNISTVLATRLEISSRCLSYSCKHPLFLSTLQRELISGPGAMDETSLFISNQLLRISKFIRRLSQLLPVIILPLSPTRIYCEDLAPHNHHIAHSVNSLGYPVVFGSQALWNKTIQSLVLSWNTLMEVTNRNYDPCNYTSSYIASNPRTFLVLDNLNNFNANWVEPDVWKAYAEAFILSFVPKKVDKNIHDPGYQSDMVEVTVAGISPSIPPNFFEELFYTADSDVIILKEKAKYVLKGMSVGKANLLVKKLNHFHVGDTVLTASTVNGTSSEGAFEFSLMQSLCILTGFEKVYRKYKREIIQSLIQKVNEIPDVTSLKFTPCMKGPTCRGPDLCYYYHSPFDTRRNPYINTYMDVMCSKSQMPNGLCQDGVSCDFSHNVYELKFHPLKYQVRLCPSGESAEACYKRDVLCNCSHKDSPEMFYLNEWEDLILFGPHHALDYFTGAIRAASKIKQFLNSNFRVILLSSSVEFLDVAVKASSILMKKFGLNVCSLENINYIASSQILVGNPISFCNLSMGIFNAMKGAIIVEDIQSILKNEKLRDNMRQSFEMIRNLPNVVLNKVFVSATFEYGLVNSASEAMGLHLKQLSDFNNDKPSVDESMVKNLSFEKQHPSLSVNLSQRLGNKEAEKESSLVMYPTLSYPQQKRARSRSPSPAFNKKIHHTKSSKSDRSRSSSPLFSKSHTELSKRFGGKLFEEYTLALEKMRQDFKGEFSVYCTMPELHPDYEKFYKSFVEMYNIQHRGKAPEHRERLWKLFWKAKVEEIKEHDWRSKQKHLLKEFDKRVLAHAPSSQSAPSRNDVSYSFAETIDLIDGICGDLGFLGPSVKAMFKSCRDLGISSKEAFKMFTESENVLLINMVLDKIKSLLPSSSGQKLLLYKKVADCIPKFLEEAQIGPTSTESKDIIDVEAIGRASVGKGSKFALDLIKTAIAYEGISNPPKQMINELFIKVCNVHYALSMDE